MSWGPRAGEPWPQAVTVNRALGWAGEHDHFRRRTWPGVWLFNRMMHHASGLDLDTTTA